MQVLNKVLNSRYLIWLLLSLPAFEYIYELLYPSRHYPEIMENSGELSMQILVFTLCITPAALVLKNFTFSKSTARWLLKSRRYFGIAGFGYAGIHTVLYVRQTFDIELIWLEAWDWPLGTGWISFWLLLDFFIDNALVLIVPLVCAKLFHLSYRVWQRQKDVFNQQ